MRDGGPETMQNVAILSFHPDERNCAGIAALLDLVERLAHRSPMPFPDPVAVASSPAANATPRLNQELADTVRRSRLGGPFYVVAWIAVCLASPAPAARSWIGWLIGATLLLGMLARFRLSPRPVAEAATARRRINRVWRIVGATAALWGGACAWLLFADTGEGTRLVALVCTVAFATAVAHSFCMRARRALLLLALLYAPVFSALLLTDAPPVVATAIGVYLGYLLLLLRRSHGEYLQRLDLEDDLRLQRDRFEQQSQLDGLTGLANRRHFSAALEQLARRSATRAEPFALLLFDLDYFKAINDRHGHAVGDACLREFAERLQRTFAPPQHLVARLGGEEFAVLIEDADEDRAVELGERFRAQIAGTPLVLPDLAIGVTVSVGAGDYGPRRTDEPDQFLAAVDQALYRAKAAGRNALRRVATQRY
jgi:diguanylate cyclase (GGDEF)-like protein